MDVPRSTLIEMNPSDYKNLRSNSEYGIFIHSERLGDTIIRGESLY